MPPGRLLLWRIPYVPWGEEENQPQLVCAHVSTRGEVRKELDYAIGSGN